MGVTGQTSLSCCCGRVELSAEKASSVGQCWLYTEFLGLMSTEDGVTGKLQIHQPVGFLHAVDFNTDATAPRNWLGILTQRRAVHFGMFTKNPGRFSNPAHCICWSVAGCRSAVPRIQVDVPSHRIATGLPAYHEDHSSIDHLIWGESGRLFFFLGLQP